MGIVDGPAMSLRASGNVGPLCYAIWRGVYIARDIWTGTQPGTTKQLITQGYLRTVSRAWSDVLTADQRDRWEEFARGLIWVNRLGLEWRPTGYQSFLKLGLFGMNLAGSYLSEPPVAIVGIRPETVVIQPGALVGEADIGMTDWAGGVEPDVIQIWRAGPYDNGGYHARQPDYRVVRYEGTPFSWTDVGLTTGKFYWYRVRWGLNIGVVGVSYEGQIEAP